MNKRFWKTLLARAGLFCAVPAFAQSLAIDWSTIAGGGGTSAGDSFLLNGTIGQTGVGATSGGVFTVGGGFWPGVTRLSGLEPTLSIRLGVPIAGVNTVILSWPNPSTGYVLQQTADMSAAGGGWVSVLQTPIIVGPNKEVTLQATGQFCMFRLRHP